MSAGMIRRQLQGGAVEGTVFCRRGRALACLLGLALALSGSVSAASAEVPANGRAWELVTPPDPVSATVFALDAIAPAGDRLMYQSVGPMPGAAAGDLVAHTLAIRGADGWRTEPIGARYLVPKTTGNNFAGTELFQFDDDLSTFLLRSVLPLVPGGPEDPRFGFYRLGPGSLTLIADLETIGSSPRAASADASHLVFSSPDHLLASDAGRVSGDSIYEATPAGLRQVDLDSAGSLLSTCGSSITDRAVSSSGERVFFMQPTDSSCGPIRVYLRESGSTTIEVSASRCTRVDCNAVQDVKFVGSTRDGSVAFVTTQQQLTDDDQNSKRDLYRFDTATAELSLLSPGSTTMEGEVMETPVLSSADGSRAYFYGTGRLLPGEGPEGAEGLYLADDGDLRFLGAIAPSILQLSADGRVAVVSTSLPLEPGDSDGKADVYRYDAVAESWLRISAGPGGGNGPLDAPFALPDASAPDPFPTFRALTRDGARVFFNTPEPLLPEDHNAVGDVYEWASGRLGLVSSGEGSDAADFVGVSPDGVTAVFQSSAGLLPGDRDGGDRDFYAARIGGGFDEPIAPPEGCGPCVTPPPSLVRPEAASARVRADRKGKIRLRLSGRAAAREAVRTGGVAIELSVPAPGRVSAEAHSRLAGKTQIAARGVGGAVQPGKLRLRMTLTQPARQALIRSHSLRLRLELRQPPLRLTRTITLTLGGGK